MNPPVRDEAVAALCPIGTLTGEIDMATSIKEFIAPGLDFVKSARFFPNCFDGRMLCYTVGFISGR